MAVKKPITCCPHCGSDEGLYTKCVYREVICLLDFNGKEQDNSEMYDNADVEAGRIIFCQHCHKSICRLSTFEKHWKEASHERY